MTKGHQHNHIVVSLTLIYIQDAKQNGGHRNVAASFCHFHALPENYVEGIRELNNSFFSGKAQETERNIRICSEMDKLSIISGALFFAANIFAIASLAMPSWIVSEVGGKYVKYT